MLPYPEFLFQSYIADAIISASGRTRSHITTSLVFNAIEKGPRVADLSELQRNEASGLIADVYDNER